MTLRPRSPPPSPLQVWLLRGPFVTSLVSLRVLPSALSSSPREKKTRLSFHPGPDSSQISVCGPVSPGPGYPVALQMCPLGYLPGSSSTSVCPVWAPRPPLGLRLGLGLLPQKRGGHLQLFPHPCPLPFSLPTTCLRDRPGRSCVRDIARVRRPLPVPRETRFGALR